MILTVNSDVGTKISQNFDFSVDALLIVISLYRHDFQMKTDMNMKICMNTRLVGRKRFKMQNRIQ